MADSSVLGRPLWYELLTTDMKAAEKFYSTVVGWTAAPFDGIAAAVFDVFTPGRDTGRRSDDDP